MDGTCKEINIELRNNNVCIDAICPICEGNTNAPEVPFALFQVGEAEPICDDCATKHAPVLLEARRALNNLNRLRGEDYSQSVKDVATPPLPEDYIREALRAANPRQTQTKRERVKIDLLRDYLGNEATAIVEISGDEPEPGKGQIIQVDTNYTLIPGCYWPAVVVQIHTHATKENILRVLYETIDLVKGENDILGFEEFEYRTNQAREKNKDLENQLCPRCGGCDGNHQPACKVECLTDDQVKQVVEAYAYHPLPNGDLPF